MLILENLRISRTRGLSYPAEIYCELVIAAIGVELAVKYSFV